MGESKKVKAPITARLGFWFAAAGSILLPLLAVPVALTDYYGISIEGPLHLLRFLLSAVFIIAILGFFGALIFVLPGLGESIYSRNRSGITLSIITILGLFFMLLVIKGVPNYSRYHSRMKQQEAKDGLYAIYEAEQDYFKQNRQYAKTFSDLKLTDLGNERYAFFLSASEVIQPKGIKKPYSMPKKYPAFVNDNSFQIIAVGNTNLNPEHDVWRINEKKQLRNLFDDVKGVEPTPYSP